MRWGKTAWLSEWRLSRPGPTQLRFSLQSLTFASASDFLGVCSGDGATKAIEQLEITSRYEAVAEFWPQYLRGQAYLKLRQGAEAATEFQKILDHRGYAPLSLLYPLAHLGLARAAEIAGDMAKSRKAHADFSAIWKDADAGLPITSLKELR